jgi:hypothetical protein
MGLRAEFRAVLARPARRKEWAVPAHGPPYSKHNKTISSNFSVQISIQIF